MTTRVSLEEQIAALTTDHTSSSTETDALRRQLTQVESEKRDLIGVVNSLREASAQREGEVDFA